MLSQSGLKVIIVDTDLRKPTQHKILACPNDKGLSDLVLQSAPQTNKYIHPTKVANLFLLPSGPKPPNPSELLASKRMQLIITQLKAEADIVLFDSSPFLSVTDAAVLGAQLDGVLILLDLGHTNRNEIPKIESCLQHVRSNLLGLVINHAPITRSYYY